MMSRTERALPILAAIGFLGSGLGLWVEPRSMLASYLAVWFAVCAIPIGASGVLFTSYLVRAGWTRDLQGPLSQAALTMPFAALLFIPVLAGLVWIYPWAAEPAGLPAFKAFYLTPWFFVLRAILYFAIWTALAVWAARAYGNDAAMTRAASAGLIVWALTVSWSGIDWLESVEPHFHSSIYGLFAISFALLAAFAFGLLVLLALKGSHQMSNASYSGVLLAALLLWAYLHAMQYIIIWAGNIPDEVVWYLTRLDGGWRYALWGLFIGQFFLPFFALLSARIRASTEALLWIAGATLAFRHLEAVVLVLPPLHVNTIALLLDLPSAVVAIGASWIVAWRFAPAPWERLLHRPAPAAR
jgi:hypothetical protein